MLVVMLGFAVYFGVRGTIARPKTKIRTTDRIKFLNRWYPIALSAYAIIGIIHNTKRLALGLNGVHVVGLALYCAILAALLVRRGFLISVVNLWVVLTLLSAIVRLVKFIQGNGSATVLREGLFSLLVAVLVYVGQNVYVSYYTTPTATKGDT